MSVASEAVLVATHLRTRYTPKKHGGYNIYEDDKIRVSLDTYVPNISIYVKMTSTNWVCAFVKDYHSSPRLHRPGEWEGYLAGLAVKARVVAENKAAVAKAEALAKEAANWAPIDDAAVFAPDDPDALTFRAALQLAGNFDKDATGLGRVRRIYVASSWRNDKQPLVVAALREAGHDVYDFKHPAHGDEGFHWKEIDDGFTNWTAEDFIQALAHPIAERGYLNDANAMEWADTFVMVLPCGRSAHLEAGWGVAAGKSVAILMAPDFEPELMYKCADYSAPDLDALLKWLGEEAP